MADDCEVAWARAEAAGLMRLDGHITDGQLARAQEFLRLRAPNSAFDSAAANASKSGSSAGVTAAAALNAWADFVEADLPVAVPYEVRFRLDAATDLMEQVEALLADPSVHPAVPVMVAGAALEEFLRSLVETAQASVSGTPSISKYGDVLKGAAIIDRHAPQQVTAMATRNEAAHGHFEAISMDAGRLFVMQVNLFISQHSSPE